MNLLIIFIVLNVINVILQTVKSICTIKCGTTMAAVANAVAYGLYTIVIIYTSCELPLMEKVFIVAAANFVGVYIVKFIENKMNKDKLWKFEGTLIGGDFYTIEFALKTANIPYNYTKLASGEKVFNVYCYNKVQSTLAKEIFDRHNMKYFVTESKITLPL